MNRVRPAARSLRIAALPLAMALAGCQYVDKYYDEYFRTGAMAAPPAPRPPMVAAMPPMLHEIPLGRAVQPEAPQRAEVPQPRPPRMASLRPPNREPPRTPAVPAKKPTPPAREAEGPTIAPGELVGSDFMSVLHVLRKPDTVQSSALSVVWTYSQAECTLQLFFYPDIQTKVFRLLKYDLKSDAGENSADRSACLHDIMAVKNDESAVP